MKKRYLHETGGHFAAWETPKLLLGDVWDWFGSEESGTGIFGDGFGMGEMRMMT